MASNNIGLCPPALFVKAMKLSQLRYFVAVYEDGSFSKAASRLNAAQSGVSARIRELEERYGVKLFERSAAGVLATETGRALYKHAVAVLRRVSEAETELTRDRAAITGHVRVGLLPTFTRSIVPAALIRMQSEYPLITVAIEEAYSGSLSKSTEAGLFDFAVVPTDEDRPSVCATAIGIDREHLVCVSDGRIKTRDPVVLRDLPPLKLVLPSLSNARRRRIDNYLSDNSIKVERILEIDAMLATLEIVSKSDWATILPGIICIADLDGTMRCARPITSPKLFVSYFRIEPMTRGLSPAAAVFSSVLCEELATALLWTCEDTHTASVM